MRKMCILILMIMGVMAVSICTTYAANDINVNVNGQAIDFPDAKPFIDENARTLIPVRFVSDALGADIKWNAELKEVKINLGEKEISMRIGNKTITVDGVAKEMDTAPTIAQERTCVPVRFVAEGLGATVAWDAETRTVFITTVTGENQLVIVDFVSNINLSKPVDAQYEELEKTLTENKVDEKTIAEVLTYVKQKTDRTGELQEKIWEWGTKKIKVDSRKNWLYITVSAS